jgi:hypothetical protein
VVWPPQAKKPEKKDDKKKDKDKDKDKEDKPKVGRSHPIVVQL